MKTTHLLAAVAAGTFLLAGCANTSQPAEQPAVEQTHESDAAPARFAVLADGAVQIHDAHTLEAVARITAPDALRLASAGDGRHVLLVAADAVQILDLGAWTEDHGDHAHHHAQAPRLRDEAISSDRPTHVVAHGGRLAIFGDGDGVVHELVLGSLADGPTRTIDLGEPHHGVAVPIESGATLVTQSHGQALPDTIRVLDASGEQIDSARCPALHGETMAGESAVLFGCAGSVVVHDESGFRSIALPDADARVGGPRGSHASDIVVADYGRSDEPRTQVALVDVATDELELVELPAAYTSATIARTADGGAIVLGTDGVLRELGVTTGEIGREASVLEAWTPPTGHGASTTVMVLNGFAFITHPPAGVIVKIDLDTFEVADTLNVSGVAAFAA